MAGLLRSRKARDLSVVFVALLGLGFRLAAQFSNVLFEPKHRAAVDSVARWVALTPPGLAGRAVAQAAAGHSASAALALLGALLFAALIGWCWWAALNRLLTTADASGPRRKTAAGVAERGALFGRFLTWLPATRTGAVAAKELRYAARDPRRRAQIISYLPIMAFPLFGLFASGGTGSRTLLTMPLVAFFLAGSLDNQFGLDGGAHAMNVLAGNDPAADMRGKCMAALITCVPVVLPLLVLVVAVSGGWALLLPAVLLTAGFVGVLAGVGCVISVRAPQALATGKNPWASRGAGTGCANGLLSLSGIFVQGVLCLPFAVILTLVRDSAPAVFAVSLVAAGYGLVVWRIGLSMATRWVWWRLPELLTLISPKAAT
jgi:ABC-2 type transport system permease protein